MCTVVLAVSIFNVNRVGEETYDLKLDFFFLRIFMNKLGFFFCFVALLEGKFC